MIDSESLPSAISLKNVKFVYPDKHLAIDGLTFNISVGEKVAFVGPNAGEVYTHHDVKWCLKG